MCRKCEERAAAIDAGQDYLTIDEIQKARNLMALNLVAIKAKVNENYQFAKAMAEGLDPDPLRRQRWAAFVTAVEQTDAMNKAGLMELQALQFNTATVQV